MCPERGASKATVVVDVQKRMLSAFLGKRPRFHTKKEGSKDFNCRGIRTEAYVLKAVLDAFELGYEVIVPADAAHLLSLKPTSLSCNICEGFSSFQRHCLEELVKTLRIYPS